ncbi:hypothetical protein CEP52_017843, partial [Fusarium oligoseptatum]
PSAGCVRRVAQSYPSSPTSCWLPCRNHSLARWLICWGVLSPNGNRVPAMTASR